VPEENMITIDLPEPIEKQFTELAIRSGMTLQSCVQKAILNYLEDLEDLADAEEIVKDHKPGDAISLDEVVKKYGLEN
jgi:predicted DNA-binding protein